MRTHAFLAASVMLVAWAAVSCNRSKEEAPPPPAAEAPAPVPAAQPVRVVAVTLGREVGADKRVTTAVDTFSPTDTIYASVDTQGAAPAATLVARWTYQDGQVVHEESQSIAPAGPASTEFHISKPDGWPKGTYRVEILLDGTSASTASFRVG
jgi:hypothetical protein